MSHCVLILLTICAHSYPSLPEKNPVLPENFLNFIKNCYYASPCRLLPEAINP